MNILLMLNSNLNELKLSSVFDFRIFPQIITCSQLAYSSFSISLSMLTIWKIAAFEQAGFPTAADHMCPLAKGHYF